MRPRRSPLLLVSVAVGLAALGVVTHLFLTREDPGAEADPFDEADPEAPVGATPVDVEPPEPHPAGTLPVEPLLVSYPDSIWGSVGTLVTVDEEVVGLRSTEGRIERLTLDRAAARWTDLRVLATERPSGGERILAARSTGGGHFRLVLLDREDFVLRVLDTGTHAEQTIDDELGRVDPVVDSMDDGFAFVDRRTDTWEIWPDREPVLTALPERALPDAGYAEGLRYGRWLRVESSCDGGRCEVVLTRVNRIANTHDEIRRHFYQELDPQGLRHVAASSDVEPRSLGATAIFQTTREEGDDLVFGYALVDIVALEEALAATPLPFRYQEGPATEFRFQACGDALWLLAIVHPGPDDPSVPRLQAVRARPEVDPRARDLGSHVNMEWERTHWTCDGEGLLVVRDHELWELR
ncbi:MAG: hypothetical protein R3B82_18960 [Sandaracinaceae bacterium]